MIVGIGVRVVVSSGSVVFVVKLVVEVNVVCSGCVFSIVDILSLLWVWVFSVLWVINCVVICWVSLGLRLCVI